MISVSDRSAANVCTGVEASKTQALKPLEETAEVFAAW